MRQSKPITNCPLSYTCHAFKDDAWHVVEADKKFSWWQVDTSANLKYDWQHAIELKKHGRLRELAQALLNRWNNQQPEKWRYTLN